MFPDVERFLEPQSAVYQNVLRELRRGRKETHWIWFIFPQLKGLGSSAMAQHFGISGEDEARAYLNHPVLGARLRACTELVNAIQDRPVEDIFHYPDNLKFRSSMTLFARIATDNEIFQRALEKYFNGGDPETLRLLRPRKTE